MQSDTRFKNEYPHGDNIFEYMNNYAKHIPAALSKIPYKNIMAAHNLLRLTLARSGRIFVGGNGGSAAISDHLKCDFEKGTASDKANNLIVHSLNSSMATFSAVGNDLGYEQTLSYQLELQRATSADTVILISSSGNSPNIVEAAKYCQARCCDLIGMTGFTGGELKRRSTIPLHIPIHNYGIVEDCHQALMHILAQYHWLSLNE